MSDKIITHPATDEYRAGYDRIFGRARKLAVHQDRVQMACAFVRDGCVVVVDNRIVDPDDWRIEMSMPEDCRLGV